MDLGELFGSQVEVDLGDLFGSQVEVDLMVTMNLWRGQDKELLVGMVDEPEMLCLAVRVECLG